MDDKRPTPPQWLPVWEKASVSSSRDLATKTGIAPQTILRLIHGQGDVSRSTVAKVAQVLRVSDERIHELRGRRVRPRFELPDEADLLDEYQRDTVRRVVKAMLRSAMADASAEHPVSLLRAARKGTTAKARGEDEQGL